MTSAKRGRGRVQGAKRKGNGYRNGKGNGKPIDLGKGKRKEGEYAIREMRVKRRETRYEIQGTRDEIR